MERKLAAIFSTDVQGYSRLMGDDEEATIHTLKTYRAVITTHIERHHGRVVDSPGDNLLAEFASAVDAVKSAVAIQQELKTRNAGLDDHRRMEFRIGLNVGDVITDEGRLYGDGVNIAARLEGLADPGGICLSESVHLQVRNKLALQYEYMGEREVKNIATPVPVYKVRLDVDGTAPVVNAKRVVRSLTQEKSEPRRWRTSIVAAVALLVVVAIAAVRYGFFLLPQHLTPSPQSLPLPDKPSIAVLPFTNMSGDPEQEYFSDGMTDDIITDLSKISGLFVIARNSVFTYKGKAVKVEEVSRELGVRYVLESSVQKAGDRVRINTQLVNATTGGHLWAERYDRELEDIFTLQDEIAQKIVFALKVKLTPEEQAQFRQAPTDNLEAYDSYLRGLEYFWRTTKETNARAQHMFERAIELDPKYAAAYAFLGFTYFMELAWHWSEDPLVLDRAFEMAQRAIALDDSLPTGHGILSWVYVWKRQYDQAIAEGKRAIALDSNSANAYFWLAEGLCMSGRPEEAIETLQKAMRLNPHYPDFYLNDLAWAYRLMGRHEEAIAINKRILIRSPDNWYAHSEQAISYIELSREEAARAEMAEALRLNPNLSLEVVRQTWPYKDPAVLEQDLDALRKAGLK